MGQSKLELAVETGKWEGGLKKAQQALNSFTNSQGGFAQALEKDNGKIGQFIQIMGKVNSTAATAKGQMNDYKRTLEQLTTQYNQLTDAQKKTVGQDYLQAIDSLKGKFMQVRREAEEFNKSLGGDTGKFGQFGGILDGIGQKMGITTNLTELLTSQTAMLTAGIGASVAIVGKATQAWAAYNSELSRQDQITSVTTGLSGGSADNMTDTMRALADTYNVDFREAINAANTLMAQFGETGDSAIQLIKDGMQGMILGDGGKLLSMIQQFAPAFQSAGVSASQLIAVIQNSEGGLFTDQNMQAIVMGIRNIRLMTKGTSDALAQLGIDGQEMSKKMSDGSMTVFDALKLVAGQLRNVDSNSKAAGEVMQTVFGRQGAMAGTNIAKAIDELNTNLEETKRQTGELGDAFADLQTANEQLNKAMREAFGYDGWEQMATGIKSKLVTALADVITNLNAIKKSMAAFFTGGTWDDIMKPFSATDAINQKMQEQVLQMANNLRKRMAGLLTFGGGTSGGTGGGGGGGNRRGNRVSTTKPEEILPVGSVAALNKELSELQKQQTMATNTVEWESYNDKIKAVTNQIKELKGELGVEALRGMKGVGISGLSKDEATTREDILKKGDQRIRDFKAPTPKDKTEVKLSEEIGKMTSGISSIAGGIESLGVELPQGLQDVLGGIQGVISILTGITTIITAIEAISAADFIKPFANGGIVPHAANGWMVPGNDHSDRTLIAASSGELILNRAQQGVLASQLQDVANGGGYTPSHISGEQIYIALNRYTRRTGKGEIVTWR